MKLFVPDFFMHIASLGSDALELMFVHRWILLCYKLIYLLQREFPETITMHIWEACWSHYRTSYFHLFIAVAIISIYGNDVIEQCLPNDEILLYFSSLAMHLDGSWFTLSTDTEQWDTNIQQRVYECTKIHGEKEPCPFAGI
ncbi:unnamed protein product [Wuchereria bancrofti]|uniref:Rab-GAP TBC domain-containing protein n=1 Tax=Wuchereria bancrofti TaxID=6293 RepID=A0A3P7FV37_WUCBA|nr:unnamed protein product [Wuchereria bancrofti]